MKTKHDFYEMGIGLTATLAVIGIAAMCVSNCDAAAERMGLSPIGFSEAWWVILSASLIRSVLHRRNA